MLSTIIAIILAILLIYVIWVNYSSDLKSELSEAKEILLGLYCKDGIKAVYINLLKPLYESVKDVVGSLLWVLVTIFAFIVLPVLSVLNAFVKVHVRNK